MNNTKCILNKDLIFILVSSPSTITIFTEKLSNSNENIQDLINNIETSQGFNNGLNEFSQIEINASLQIKKRVGWAQINNWSKIIPQNGGVIAGISTISQNSCYRLIVTQKDLKTDTVRNRIVQTYNYGYFTSI